MESRTEKLPKGRSYPLRPSILSAAVEASGILIPVQLTRWDRGDFVFEASFMPNGFVKLAEHELFWVCCRAVPSSGAKEARTVIEQQAIPQFIEWAKSIDKLDATSTVRRESQTFRFPVEGVAS
ncbi:hypothetical protein [Sphingobium sp. WCS2017Hpa-17]|uniref:hypothetical protein n=1 Tax=Sphingobium sp. WCS2017Hpa-17 TaxID=3073638 RepID=UPI00288AFD1A|nr:hypothetical protein [Sphingobium sp. WCS2017Hpa-17]